MITQKKQIYWYNEKGDIMKKILFILMISATLFLTGCTSSKGEVYNISSADLKPLLSEDYQFVDIRTSEEYTGKLGPSHIDEFNINIDYYKFEKDYSLLNELDKEKPVVIICATGSRSKSASIILKTLGFKIVYNVEDGIQGWVRN